MLDSVAPWTRVTGIVLLSPLLVLGSLFGPLDPPSNSVPGRPGSDGLYGTWTSTIDELDEPTSIAWSPRGLWVATAGDHQVRRFAPGDVPGHWGSESVRFGGYGTEPGRFRTPAGIAAFDGQVFVSDFDNDRIQVFDADGRWLRSFGTSGSGAGELDAPLGLSVHGARLAVADSGNHRVQLFDLEGQAIASLGGYGTEPGQLIRPTDVAFADDGRLVVCDRSNDRLQVFSADGEPRSEIGLHGFGLGAFSAPTGITVRGDRVWVADRDNHRIQVFSLSGRWIGAWGVHAIRPREGRGKLHYPIGVALAPDGSGAAILEARANRVQRFDPGESSLVWTPADPGIAVSSTPHFGAGGAADEGLLCVLQPEAHAVLVHDLSPGRPIEIAQVGGFGSGPGQLRYPRDVLVDGASERFWVSDRDNRRLVQFEVPRADDAPLAQVTRSAYFIKAFDFSNGSVRTKLGLPHVPVPGALAETNDGRIVVLDERNGCVLLLSPNLRERVVLGQPGSLVRPTGVATSPADERLWVVDAATCELVVFDLSEPAAAPEGYGTHGRSPGELGSPFGVARDASGRGFVTDRGRHALVRFDSDGRFDRVFGSVGLEAGLYYKPRDVFLSSGDELCVIDQGNHRLQFLSPEGAFADVFGARLYTQPARRRR